MYLLHGSGTTLESIISAINNNELNARINLVVSDNPNAYALERAQNNDIETYIIQNNSKNKDDLDREL